MSKKSLSNGVSLKVQNRSGFDKSFFNALTTGVGTLTPLVKQLMIPGSSGKCRVKISAQLPPLATDAFLRSHLKLEAFFVPMRLCYGGFESWFCGKEIWDSNSNAFVRAELPRLLIPSYGAWNGTYGSGVDKGMNERFGASSLLDYFGAFWNDGASFDVPNSTFVNITWEDDGGNDVAERYTAVNIFPWISYALIYDEFYRNKFVERPLFSPPSGVPTTDGTHTFDSYLRAYNLPYMSMGSIVNIVGASNLMESSPLSYSWSGIDSGSTSDALLNGDLTSIRQRNYGDDYFTAAMPSPQEGSPVSVNVVSNQFTIKALRLANALQEFQEISGYASPDYIQTLTARYGASLKYGVAQKPVFLGSADFPMYTSGVEQTAQSGSQTVNTPFDTVGARYGRAHAEGTDFVCDFDIDEPGYFMVIASLVPEAQYFRGCAKDLGLFTKSGSITDLPVSTLESIGNEAISVLELDSSSTDIPFGYVQRYLYHKLGNRNQVHGKFRLPESLGSFVVQRETFGVTGIDTSFLKVRTTDLDNVAAVSAGISGFGVMIDSAIDLYVSEPLTESAIPSLVDPAKEHGHSVYVKTGGSKLA